MVISLSCIIGIQKHRTLNLASYSNPEAEKLLEEGRTTSDKVTGIKPRAGPMSTAA
ncbi:MAG: hypothetical protein PHY05_07700 [Methanothrix sp.]|nr:hypothetical protein [Methanothrix sp.]